MLAVLCFGGHARIRGSSHGRSLAFVFLLVSDPRDLLQMHMRRFWPYSVFLSLIWRYIRSAPMRGWCTCHTRTCACKKTTRRVVCTHFFDLVFLRAPQQSGFAVGRSGQHPTLASRGVEDAASRRPLWMRSATADDDARPRGAKDEEQDAPPRLLRQAGGSTWGFQEQGGASTPAAAGDGDGDGGCEPLHARYTRDLADASRAQGRRRTQEAAGVRRRGGSDGGQKFLTEIPLRIL